MVKKIYKNIQRTPSHVGEILKSGFIDQHDLSVAEISRRLDIDADNLSAIIDGNLPVTPDIAAKLEILTKTPSSQWLAIQEKHDAYIIGKKS
jgi:addiction module HigA family antidote